MPSAAVVKTVNVTQQDIDLGVRSNPRYCPIGRALNRVFKIVPNSNPAYRAMATAGSVIRVPGYRDAQTSKAMRDFMNVFDLGGRCVPARFRVSLTPEEVPS